MMVISNRMARFARMAAALVIMASVAACANKEGDPNSALLGPGGKGDIVYFSTDQTDLTPEAQQTLTSQARWLQQYAQYSITIEGHADERGTREYNIALGAKRSQSVRDFLSRNGINGQRIRTISFGKERPVAVCNDISCWSQNRRAQTVLNNRTAQAAQ
jgi:peptidoglycan-associated lipoprotein